MNESQLSIGPLMKAARKFKKFNQSDVAQAIGCSQSALSKMEHNLLVPSAPQWFLFSRYTSIPPETIETGIIDRRSRVKLSSENVPAGYKIPKRYRSNRLEKVREIYPLLTYFEKRIKVEEFNHFFNSLTIDPEFFLDFDNLINFQLLVDLINLFVHLKKTSPQEIRSVVELGQDDIYWDKFAEGVKGLEGYKEVLSEFAKEQACFQVDFKIQLEEQNDGLIVTYIPESHVYHFLKDVTDETRSWLVNYRKMTLENLVRRTLGIEIEAKFIPLNSNSPLESRFEIH